MPDRLVLSNGQVHVTTDEGVEFHEKECVLDEVLRRLFEGPKRCEAAPDGFKFRDWNPPRLAVVMQIAPHVRRLNWIRKDSPEPFGHGTTYHPVRVSLPYMVVFAVYSLQRDDLVLSDDNELYFATRPLQSWNDRLCYPALLNISKVKIARRTRAWLCTEHLPRRPGRNWVEQWEDLLTHTFDGSFNLSSEAHEGASWYSESAARIPEINPIESWEQHTRENPAFALHVPWLPVPQTVREIVDSLLTETPEHMTCRHLPDPEPPDILTRFVNHVQAARHRRSS